MARSALRKDKEPSSANNARNTPSDQPLSVTEDKRGLDYITAGLALLAAIGAIAAAGFTGWQALIASDTAKRQLRAYVAVEHGSLDIKDNTLYVVLGLKNFGATPAYDLSAWTQIGVQPNAQAFIHQPFNFDDGATMVTALVGAGATVFPRLSLVIPEENKVIVPGLQSGRVTAYIWGQARYWDSFQEPWCLDFRLQIYLVRQTGNWVLQPTPDGNKESRICVGWPD